MNQYDFALLELSTPILLRPQARPVHLPSAEDQEKLDKSTVFAVSGWGKTQDKAKDSEWFGTGSLQGVSINYFPNEEVLLSLQ